MTQEGLLLKISLNKEETRAIDHLSDTTCGGVNCDKCPFMLENTNGRCLRTLAGEVKDKLVFDPRKQLAYITVKLNN